MRIKTLLPTVVFATLLTVSCSQDNELAPQTTAEQATHVIPVEVRKQQALKIVDYLSKDSEPGTRSSGIVGSRNITSVRILGSDRQPLTKGSENEAAYYVFRFGDHEGFAIMGADDRLPQLLAVGQGDPNPGNPDADLPESDFWTPPVVNEADTGTVNYPPLEDPDIWPPEYVKLLKQDPIPTHWGTGVPFNKLVTSDSLEFQYELRVPTAVAAMAQMMTAPSMLKRKPTIEDSYGGDPIDLKTLRNYRYKVTFGKDSIGIDMVTRLYRMLQDPDHIHSAYYRDYIFLDKITNKEYIAGIVMAWSSLSEGEDTPSYLEKYDAFHKYLRRMGFHISPRQNIEAINYLGYDIIKNTLNEGGFILSEEIEHQTQYDDYPKHQTLYSIGHNIMYNMYEPNDRYLLLNRCQGGNGDGYYYLSTIETSFYILTWHQIWPD